MNRVQQLFIESLNNETADYLMVRATSDAMIVKLTEKRRQGRQGWFKLHELTNEKLLGMLKKNLQTGDMVDVLNIAAMIYTRTELYGDEA